MAFKLEKRLFELIVFGRMGIDNCIIQKVKIERLKLSNAMRSLIHDG